MKEEDDDRVIRAGKRKTTVELLRGKEREKRSDGWC